jgi:hypothetical protein
MPDRIEIDSRHSRAIVREVGERLRASLTPEPDLPAGLKDKIERLRELDVNPPKLNEGPSAVNRRGRNDHFG